MNWSWSCGRKVSEKGNCVGLAGIPPLQGRDINGETQVSVRAREKREVEWYRGRIVFSSLQPEETGCRDFFMS